MQGGADIASPLSLRVMRLCRPGLHHMWPTGLPLSGASESIMSLSDGLALPKGFGSLYLGEVFSCYITLQCQAGRRVRQVNVKVELQTPTTKKILLDVPADNSWMDSLATKDFVVKDDVKEMGAHVLMCTATYRDGEEQKSFRKYYKFNVSHPLSVKTRQYNLQDTAFVEIQVQNVTTGPMLLSDVKFNPSAGYKVQSITQDDDFGVVAGVPAVHMISPGDVKQYLWQLLPRDGPMADPDPVFGKLEIVWKTNLGEPGRLQTNPVSRKALVKRDIRVSVFSMPNACELEVPFEIQLAIANKTSRNLNLRLNVAREAQQQGGVMVLTAGGTRLPRIAPNATLIFPLALVAIFPGLHLVSGIRLEDLDEEGRLYDVENTQFVFVDSSDQPATEIL